MLQTKFQGHRSIGSGEEDFFFFQFSPYMGMVAIILSCDLDGLNIFLFPPILKATYEILLQLA